MFVSSAESMNVQYYHPQGSYCFAAANLTNLNETCTFPDYNADISDSEGNGTSPWFGNDLECQGRTVLVAGSDEVEEDWELFPTIYMAAMGQYTQQ